MSDYNPYEDNRLYHTLTRRYQAALQPALKRWDAARKAWGVYEGNAWKAINEMAVNTADTKLAEFNMIAKYINAVLGQQLNTKRKITFSPRSVDKSVSGEMLSSASVWFADESNLDSETSDVFKDCVIGGIGCLEVSLSFDDDPKGAPYARRINPMEMLFDADAVRTNLSDSRIMFRLTRQHISTLQKMFPGRDRGDFGFEGGVSADKNTVGDLTLQARGIWPRAGEQTDEPDGDDEKVWLLEARWLEQGEEYWLDADSWAVYSPDEYREARKQNPAIRAVKRHKPKTRRAFFGSHGFLDAPDEPLCKPGTFGWFPLTCYRSETEKDYYGLVRNAVDAQMFINQYISMMNKTMLSQSKGGIIVEEGAVPNPEKFERDWGKSDSIIWVPKGNIDKFKPKPLGEIPEGMKEIFAAAKEAVPEGMGISPEFLGTTDRDQPGILEETRKRSTLNVLTEVYDNLRRLRIELGRGLGYIIQNFIPNGVLMRINDADEAQYVQFARASVANLEYDVVVDEVPNTMDEKQETFAYISQLTPIAMQWVGNGCPMDLVKLMLRYSPLPADFVNKACIVLDQWQANNAQGQSQAAAAQSQAAQTQAQIKQAELGIEQQKIQAQANDSAQDNQVKMAEVEARREDTALRAQTELAKTQAMSQPQPLYS